MVSSLGGLFDTSWVNQLWPEDVYYYPSTFLACPYLPDVFARGASFQGLPGSVAVDNPVLVPFGGTSPWPAVVPLNLVFSAGTGAPSLTTGSSGNTLAVQAPPGTIPTRRYRRYRRGSQTDRSLERVISTGAKRSGETCSCLSGQIPVSRSRMMSSVLRCSRELL